MFFYLAMIIFMIIPVVIGISIYQFIKKTGKAKKYLKLTGALIVAFMVCAVIGAPDIPEEHAAAKDEQQTINDKDDKLKEEADKKAEEDRLKADAEKKAKEDKLKIEAEEKAKEEKLKADAAKKAEEEKLAAANKLPDYKVELIDDSNIGKVIRQTIHIVVPGEYTLEGLYSIAEKEAKKYTANSSVNALAIGFYKDRANIGKGYDMGQVEYVPFGEWSKAMDIKAGEYKDFEFVNKLREPLW